MKNFKIKQQKFKIKSLENMKMNKITGLKKVKKLEKDDFRIVNETRLKKSFSRNCLGNISLNTFPDNSQIWDSNV